MILKELTLPTVIKIQLNYFKENKMNQTILNEVLTTDDLEVIEREIRKRYAGEITLVTNIIDDALEVRITDYDVFARIVLRYEDTFIHASDFHTLHDIMKILSVYIPL